jgi:hypothetical protein
MPALEVAGFTFSALNIVNCPFYSILPYTLKQISAGLAQTRSSPLPPMMVKMIHPPDNWPIWAVVIFFICDDLTVRKYLHFGVAGHTRYLIDWLLY